MSTLKTIKDIVRFLTCAWIGYCISECLKQGRAEAAVLCAIVFGVLVAFYIAMDLIYEKKEDGECNE